MEKMTVEWPSKVEETDYWEGDFRFDGRRERADWDLTKMDGTRWKRRRVGDGGDEGDSETKNTEKWEESEGMHRARDRNVVWEKKDLILFKFNFIK